MHPGDSCLTGQGQTEKRRTGIKRNQASVKRNSNARKRRRQWRSAHAAVARNTRAVPWKKKQLQKLQPHKSYVGRAAAAPEGQARVSSQKSEVVKVNMWPLMIMAGVHATLVLVRPKSEGQRLNIDTHLCITK
jgi:hypothetical protein